MRLFSFGNNCPVVKWCILKGPTWGLIGGGGGKGTNVNSFLWRLLEYHQWFVIIVQDEAGPTIHGTKFKSQLLLYSTAFLGVPTILEHAKVVRVALLFRWESAWERRRRWTMFKEPVILFRYWSRMLCVVCPLSCAVVVVLLLRVCYSEQNGKKVFHTR
jgi:hypothetical protein